MNPPEHQVSLLQRVLESGPTEFFGLLVYVLTIGIFISRRLFFRTPLAHLDVVLMTLAGIFIFCCVSSGLSVAMVIPHTRGIDADIDHLFVQNDTTQRFLLLFVLSALVVLASTAIPPKRTVSPK